MRKTSRRTHSIKHPAMLDQIKEGDKIKFSADKVDGALTVAQLEATH